MDNLEKALRCIVNNKNNTCINILCRDCEYYHAINLTTAEILEAVIERIHQLEKSNRNWRRKVQRLRKELKEVKHEE